MTAEQAEQILTTLKAALPHGDKGLDPFQAKMRDAVYRKLLLSWGVASAQEAVQTCLLASRYYPTMAELHDAYSAAVRAKPERARPALPPSGGSLATPDEVRAACAEAQRIVMANVVPESTGRRRPRAITHSDGNDAESLEADALAVVSAIGAPAVAPAEDELAMIQRTIARAAARKGEV